MANKTIKLQYLRFSICLTVFILPFSASGSWGADWPQYRADAARSAYTTEELPRELALDWTRQPQSPPHRAWVGRLLSPSRMKFDWCFAPVVASGMLFFGSSANHEVHALDAKTGEEKWNFFTSGPVRLAPAVWKDRVLAVSDDGYLYCLNARTGDLVWKLRGGPREEWMIGNGRLVSRWMGRGGPAVRDGVVYFAAGIWPLEGVYVYAVNIADGRVIWRNASSGAYEIEHPHMGSVARGAVTAQGYLAVAEDKVYVATGRSTPAVYDRKTGRLEHFHLSRYGGKTPWGVGGGDTVALDEAYYNGGYVFDAATGLRYSSVDKDDRWTSYVIDGHDYHGEFIDGPRRNIAVTPEGLLFFKGQKIFGGTLQKITYVATRESNALKYSQKLPFDGDVKVGNAKYHGEKIDNAPFVKLNWSANSDVAPTAMIVAGKVAYLGSENQVLAFDTITKKPVWTGKAEGIVRALAASDGRLYAATDSGAIHCYAANGSGRVLAPRKEPSPYPDKSPLSEAADKILRETGIRKGFVLDVECGDGELAWQIARKSELYVVAIDLSGDPHRESVRRKLNATGLYGSRIAVIAGLTRDIALPPNFANLIVSQGEIERDGGLLAERYLPYLSPTRGKFYPTQERKFISRSPLKGAGSWTHNLGDSGNSLCSDDEIVGGPLGILWFKDETILSIDRHGKNPAPLVSDGVMVQIGLDEVKAVDAYNGTLLWRRNVSGLLRDYQGGTGVGAVAIGGVDCIEDGVVYLRNEDYCLALDLLSGDQIAKHKAPLRPDGKAGTWGYLAIERGILFGSLSNETFTAKGQHGNGDERVQGPMDRHFTESIALFALDAKSGELKWEFAAKDSIRNNAIAVGNGRVYLIDRPVAEIDNFLKPEVAKRRRTGEPLPEHPTGVLICLDAASGKEKWKEGKDVFGTVLALSKKHDLLVMSYNKVGRSMPSENNSDSVRCYQAKTGESLWDAAKMGARPILNDRTIYSYPGAYDLFTGKSRPLDPAAEASDKTRVRSVAGKGIGCGTPIASRDMLFVRSGAVGYYDIKADLGWIENYGGIRSGCWLNAIPAGGIVLIPDDTRACRCSFPNQASIALYQRGIRPPEVRPAAGQKNWAYTQKFTSNELDFTGKLEIEIIPPKGAQYALRYTLDGAIPTADSPLYSKPISIDQTVTVNAAAYHPGGAQASLLLGLTCAKVDALEKRKGK